MPCVVFAERMCSCGGIPRRPNVSVYLLRTRYLRFLAEQHPANGRYLRRALEAYYDGNL